MGPVLGGPLEEVMPEEEADTGMQRTIQVVTKSGGWPRKIGALAMLLGGVAIMVFREHSEHTVGMVMMGLGAADLGIQGIGRLMPGGKK